MTFGCIYFGKIGWHKSKPVNPIQLITTINSGLWMSLKLTQFGSVIFNGSCNAQLLSGYNSKSISITEFYSTEIFRLTFSLTDLAVKDVLVETNDDEWDELMRLLVDSPGILLFLRFEVKGVSSRSFFQFRFRMPCVLMERLKVTRMENSVSVEIPRKVLEVQKLEGSNAADWKKKYDLLAYCLPLLIVVYWEWISHNFLSWVMWLAGNNGKFKHFWPVFRRISEGLSVRIVYTKDTR